MEKVKKDNSYKHILKYTGIFGGVQGLNILVGVVRNKFTALFLGPAGMGLLSLFNSTSTFLTSAFNLGIPTSGVKLVADSVGRTVSVEDTVCLVRSFSLLSAFLGAIICVLLGPLLNLFTFDWGNHTLHFVLLAPTVFFTILAGGEVAILKALGRLKALATQAFMLAVLSLLFAVPIYWLFGEKGILPVLFLVSFSQWLLNFRYSRRAVPLRLRFSRSELARGVPLVRLGMSFVLAGMMSTGAEFLVRAYLNTKGDLEMVGLFNAGVTIVIVYAGMVFSVMESDYYPRLSAIVGDRLDASVVERRNLDVNRQLEINILLIGPIIVAMVLGLPIIIPLLYDGKFMGMLTMTQIAAVSMLFKAVYLPIEYLPLSRGESKVFLVQESFCVILLVVCEILGYMLGGLCGLGVGIVVAYAIEMSAVLIFSRCYYRFALSRKGGISLLVQVVCAALMLLVISQDYHSWPYWVWGAMVVLVSLLYSGLLIKKSLRK